MARQMCCNVLNNLVGNATGKLGARLPNTDSSSGHRQWLEGWEDTHLLMAVHTYTPIIFLACHARTLMARQQCCALLNNLVGNATGKLRAPTAKHRQFNRPPTIARGLGRYAFVHASVSSFKRFRLASVSFHHDPNQYFHSNCFIR